MQAYHLKAPGPEITKSAQGIFDIAHGHHTWKKSSAHIESFSSKQTRRKHREKLQDYDNCIEFIWIIKHLKLSKLKNNFHSNKISFCICFLGGDCWLVALRTQEAAKSDANILCEVCRRWINTQIVLVKVLKNTSTTVHSSSREVNYIKWQHFLRLVKHQADGRSRLTAANKVTKGGRLDAVSIHLLIWMPRNGFTLITFVRFWTQPWFSGGMGKFILPLFRERVLQLQNYAPYSLSSSKIIPFTLLPAYRLLFLDVIESSDPNWNCVVTGNILYWPK